MGQTTLEEQRENGASKDGEKKPDLDPREASEDIFIS